jgi:Nas2 N_terminal domain
MYCYHCGKLVYIAALRFGRSNFFVFEFFLMADLIREQRELEQLIDELESVLASEGVGLTGGLVDKDGYPLADVSRVLSIRTVRHKLMCAKTDYRLLMARIEKQLAVLLPASQEILEETHSSSPSASSSNSHNAVGEEVKPLCVIGDVEQGGAADLAGLKEDDMVYRIGSIRRRRGRATDNRQFRVGVRNVIHAARAKLPPTVDVHLDDNRIVHVDISKCVDSLQCELIVVK